MNLFLQTFAGQLVMYMLYNRMYIKSGCLSIQSFLYQTFTTRVFLKFLKGDAQAPYIASGHFFAV